MRFRPCIDIHNGKVKQIVGGTLLDEGDRASENFVSQQDAAYYAALYKRRGLSGGHVILLNAKDSPYYEQTKAEALAALAAYPNGLMAGGGIDSDTAPEFLAAGASHVIVTSYVFKDGKINEEHLEKLVAAIGREHLVLDLSCRKRDGVYVIVTDRWQKFTDTVIDARTLCRLEGSCSEFLIHAVDVEGKASGIDTDLVRILAGFPAGRITYAGGVGSFDDLRALKEYGRDKIDVTIGSALDLFGGSMPFEEVLSFLEEDAGKTLTE